jgi:hypothetical protein
MEGSRTKGRTTIEVGADGVALITIINPPVNSLSFDGITRSSSFFFLYLVRIKLDLVYLVRFMWTLLIFKLDFLFYDWVVG